MWKELCWRALYSSVCSSTLPHMGRKSTQLFRVVNRLSEVRKCDAFHPNRDAYEHSLSPEALLKLTLRKHFYSAGYSFC